MTSTTDKTLILDALRAFVRQRPGLDYRNYGDAASYRADMRGITRALADYWQLEAAVLRHEDITAQSLLDAARSAYSARLEIVPPHAQGTYDCAPIDASMYRINYCTGQYWCTEFRNAACAVLASALWTWQRTHAMPTNTGKLSAGDWLRDRMRREFGRGIQSRWFN